jgi:hypothetical protein
MNLDVDAPDKVASVLTAAATAYQSNAVELSATWQDRQIPMICVAIASELVLPLGRGSGQIRSAPHTAEQVALVTAPSAAVEGADGVGSTQRS